MYDVVIIGSGPAGYTAAIYASRALLKTLVIAGPQPGGQLTTTTEVENFPGFSSGIDGTQLLEEMQKQAARFGTEIKAAAVAKIAKDKTFLLTTDQAYFEAKAVIVATGASAKKLDIPSEEKYRGKGISYCATCDGFFYKTKEVVVIGGGDTAMEEATFLTRFASKVTIIHRREEFRASPIMLEKARKNEKITFVTNKIITEIVGDSTVQAVKLKDAVTGEASEYPTQGIFVAIGHTPNTDFLKGLVDLDEKGYIKIIQTMTSVPGIFAAGDCVDSRYRQAVVAAGMGSMAAIDAQKWLEEQK